MSRSFTAKSVEGLFEHFVAACGKRRARSYSDVGGWGLDYNPVYGGLVIYEIANTGGAHSHPFGSERHKPRELWYMMRFAMDAIRIASRRGDPSRRGPRHRSARLQATAWRQR